MKFKDIVIRYGFATMGLCLVAMGIVLSVEANCGISVLNAPGYAISAKTGLPLGFTCFAFFMLCVVFQWIILGKRFQVIDLLQVAANSVLGFMIDFFTFLFEALAFTPGSIWGVVLFIGLSIVFQAFGISMEVVSQAWMLPSDMTVRAIGMAWGGKFSDNKIKMDCTILVIAILLCLIFFGNIFGPKDQPIIGWGTLILAITIGLFMKISTPAVRRIPYFKNSAEIKN